MSETQSGSSSVSSARLAANRANARKSTGPRTPEGKARASRNALIHGAFARDIDIVATLLGDVTQDWESLQEELEADCAPVGFRERLVVEQMAATWWRLRRLSNHGQQELAVQMADGDTVEALKAGEALSPWEGRLQGNLMRLDRHLAQLQRARIAADTQKLKRESQAARTGHDTLAASLFAKMDAEREDLLARTRERRRQAEAEALAAHAPEGSEGGEAEADASGEQPAAEADYLAAEAAAERSDHAELEAILRDRSGA